MHFGTDGSCLVHKESECINGYYRGQQGFAGRREF